VIVHTLAKRRVQQGERVLALYQQSLRNGVLHVVHRLPELVFTLRRLKRSNGFCGCRNRLCHFDYFRKNSILLVLYHAPVIDECAYAKPLNFTPTAFEEQLPTWS